MKDDINKRLCSGIKSLDKLGFKAAGSRTGCIGVSIEELNAIRTEMEAQQPVEREKLCHYALGCDYEPPGPNCGTCDYYYAAPGTALGNKL